MLGFQEAFGMSPVAYHKRLRLNGARRQLLRASPHETTVTQVALDWGFDHFGRFSVDYRQLFSESPISTLRKRRGLSYVGFGPSDSPQRSVMNAT